MKPSIRFQIQNQNISRIDSFRVVAASRNYLHAEFAFLTHEWCGVAKTAIFEYSGGVKQVLLEKDCCAVPWEALVKPGILKVSVFGGDLITVGQALVQVSESGYKDGSAPSPPTPDLYEQILATANEAKEIAESVRKDADDGVFDGADGHTPELGVDYFTDEDVDKIVDKLLEKLPGQGEGSLPAYEGDVEVTPSFEGQVLPTKGRSLYEDITIHPIKVTETANKSGGITVSI